MCMPLCAELMSRAIRSAVSHDLGGSSEDGTCIVISKMGELMIEGGGGGG